MRRLIQRILLLGYRGLRRTGLLATGPGQAASGLAYRLYKAWLERDAGRLHAFVPQGATVVDVGANVGFYTLAFGRWVGPAGWVVAIEPEPANCAALTRAVMRAGLGARVEIVRAAAADLTGELRLALNPDNPADHRLADDGIPVPAVRIDGLLEARGWPEVALIKIDVQGAEPRVLAGAVETLQRLRPALYIELDDVGLRAAGSSADALIDWLAGYGYVMYVLDRQGARPVSRGEVWARCKELGYADFLFLSAGTDVSTCAVGR